MAFIVRGTLSVSRLCPECSQSVARERDDQSVICPCGWVWLADAIAADPKVVYISAGIQGRAS